MQASKWIIEAQSAGWRVTSSRDRTICLCCARQGCKGALSLPLDNLGPIPKPCALDHHGQYGQATYEIYKGLVGELVRRRRALGISQEDLSDAAGMADGHINKLEAFARTAQFPTLQLWAQTLGAEITLRAAPLPDATARAIERRPAPLRETSTQKALFDDR